MNLDLLYCLKMTDNSGDFNLAAEMFSALELDFSSLEDRENRCVYHIVYAQTPELAAEGRRKIEESLTFWRDLGVALSNFEELEIKKEDWANVWKKYFDIIQISPKLAIKPSWLEYTPLPGQAVLEIDPGMSFGTGQHATTFFCLQMIDELTGKPEVKSMLDAGCGSGILAIAGSLLKYHPIDAFDYDPDAVMIAKENFELNHINDITPTVADAADYRGKLQYDLVCANILGHLLKAYRKNISTWVRPGGYLVLAGILATEFDSVRDAFAAQGFTELKRDTLREWTSGLFLKQN